MKLRKMFVVALLAPLGFELPLAAQEGQKERPQRAAMQELLQSQPTSPEQTKKLLGQLKQMVGTMKERNAPAAAIERMEARIKALETSLQEEKKEGKAPALNDDVLPPEFGVKVLKLEFMQKRIGHLRSAAQDLKAAEAHDLAMDIMAKAEALEKETIVAKQMLGQEVDRFKRQRSAEVETRERIEKEMEAQAMRARERDEALMREREKIEREMDMMRKREQEQAQMMERQKQELEAVRQELRMREEAMRKEAEQNERQMRERAERQAEEARERAAQAMRESEERVRAMQEQAVQARREAEQQRERAEQMRREAEERQREAMQRDKENKERKEAVMRKAEEERRVRRKPAAAEQKEEPKKEEPKKDEAKRDGGKKPDKKAEEKAKVGRAPQENEKSMEAMEKEVAAMREEVKRLREQLGKREKK